MMGINKWIVVVVVVMGMVKGEVSLKEDNGDQKGIDKREVKVDRETAGGLTSDTESEVDKRISSGELEVLGVAVVMRHGHRAQRDAQGLAPQLSARGAEEAANFGADLRKRYAGLAKALKPKEVAAVASVKARCGATAVAAATALLGKEIPSDTTSTGGWGTWTEPAEVDEAASSLGISWRGGQPRLFRADQTCSQIARLLPPEPTNEPTPQELRFFSRLLKSASKETSISPSLTYSQLPILHDALASNSLTSSLTLRAASALRALATLGWWGEFGLTIGKSKNHSPPTKMTRLLDFDERDFLRYFTHNLLRDLVNFVEKASASSSPNTNSGIDDSIEQSPSSFSNSPEVEPKFSFYVGHETNIFALLSLFGLTDESCLLSALSQTPLPLESKTCHYYPNFLSNLTFEVLIEKSTGSRLLRALYNGDEVAVCPYGKSVCLVSEFAEFVDSILGSDYVHFCKLGTKTLLNIGSRAMYKVQWALVIIGFFGLIIVLKGKLPELLNPMAREEEYTVCNMPGSGHLHVIEKVPGETAELKEKDKEVEEDKKTK